MIIHTLWITRKHEDDWGPELVEAWDYNSVDENPQGFREACEKAIATNDVEEYRYIDVTVDDGAILDAFRTASIKGEVS